MDDMNRLGDLILKHWTTHRPGADGGTGADEPVAARPPPGPGTDGRSSLHSDRDSEDGVSRGLGTGDAGMGVPSGRGPPEAASSGSSIVRQTDPEPDPVPSRDFRITDADRIGEGSLREKAFDNIEAIRTLKRIEAESRAADWRGKIPAREIHRLGRDGECLPPLSAARMGSDTAAELRELLTAPEYDSARASTPNAHFTSPMVIRAIWQAMQRFGFEPGAQILEPSMGVGHFFGLMPESSAARQPPDRRRTRRHHGAHRKMPLSGCDHLRQGLRGDGAAR